MDNIIEIKVAPIQFGYGYYDNLYEHVRLTQSCFYCGNSLRIEDIGFKPCPSCGARDWDRKRRER